MISVKGFKKDGSDYLNYGTGVIVDEHGTILTNKHLLPNPMEFEAYEISCAMGKFAFRNKSWKIKEQPVAIHPTADLVLLQIEDFKKVKESWPAIKPVKIGDSERYDGGDEIYVMSFPEAMPLTIHRGMINGPDETNTMWRTDAPLNPGSSGGLVIGADAEGPELESIATVEGATRFSSTGVPTDGWGYIIPAKQAAPLFAQPFEPAMAQSDVGAEQSGYDASASKIDDSKDNKEADLLRLVDRVRPEWIANVVPMIRGVSYNISFKAEEDYIVEDVKLESFDRSFRILSYGFEHNHEQTNIWCDVELLGDRKGDWVSESAHVISPDDMPLILTTIQKAVN